MPKKETESLATLAVIAWLLPIKKFFRDMPPSWPPNIAGGCATRTTPVNATGMEKKTALFTGCPRMKGLARATRHGDRNINTVASCSGMTCTDQ